MKNYVYHSLSRISLLFVLAATLSLSSFAQGFSTETQTRLQKVIETFQNDPANPYIGGMSVAIKVDGLAFWQGATGYAARAILMNRIICCLVAHLLLLIHF